jgi:glycosyltransferase involved in cell wall biosynthesis
VVQCVEDECDASRDAEFFKDSEEILLDGVFAERQFLGNLAIGKALGLEGDNLLLAWRHQNLAVGVHNPQGWNLRNHIDEEIDLLGRRPDLAAVHNLNALAERSELRCGETMVVSKTLRSYYRRQYGARTRYVANGAILRDKQMPPRIHELGLASGKYILFLGRFSPEKNCHLLIDAFERIETPVKLVLAGGGSASDAYSQRLREDASDRIVLLDYVSGSTFDEFVTNACCSCSLPT